MDDFAPPSGPPPPKAPQVPAGWVARWNEQYKEWFYVNVHTKKSQWEMPTSPAYPADDKTPDDPPPMYEAGPGSDPTRSDTKKKPLDEPEKAGDASSSLDSDAKLAAKLQAEEDARARLNPGGPQPPAGYGGADSYPQRGSSPCAQDSFPQELPPRDRKSGGFLGKFFGKGKTPVGGQQGLPAGYGGYSPQPPQQNYYSSAPQQYAGYPYQGYGPGYGGGYGGPSGYGGGYGAQPGYYAQQQPPRKAGMGGMGMGLAGGALGLGAGVLGGALIADAIHDHNEEAYMDGYHDGQDNDFGGGGDYGGGDFGGGDFGGGDF